jgi:putative ABC transport system permease protein
MHRITKLLSLAHNLVHRGRVDRDLDSELRSYVEMLAEQKREQGLTAHEAWRAARIELGGVEQVKEQIRDVRAGAWMESLVRDLCYAARMLRRSPGFAVVTVVTLALGIGANTALFSFVDALLLRRLPYTESERLVYVSEFWPREPVFRRVPSPDYGKWRALGKSFDGMEGYTSSAASNMTGQGEPQRVERVMVTAGLLDLLGVRTAAGRNFLREEDRPGAAPVALISYRLWEQHFSLSQDVIGKMIELDGKAHCIVGVLPASFVFPDNEVSADLLVPLAMPASPGWNDPDHFRVLKVVARLKPGALPNALQAELTGIARSTATTEPAQFANMRRDLQVTATPLRERLSGNVRSILLILQAAVGMVLMICCLNVANLQIARSVTRQNEIALRTALGAGRGRLVRQLLTESLLLSLLGGSAGLAGGYSCLRILRQFQPTNLHLLDTVRIDTAALIFTLAIALLTGIVTGLAPSHAAFRTSLNLGEWGGRTTATGGQHRMRAALVVAQVALAMVLLSGSGLLIRAFVRLAGINPGFDPRGVLTLRVSLRGSKYAALQSQEDFSARLLELATALPGIRSAAVAGGAPVLGSWASVGTAVEGRPLPAPGTAPDVPYMPVSSGYFHSVGIPLLRGRGFSAGDRDDSPQVAIVSEAFAREFFPLQDPIGKHIKTGAMTGPWREVVGLAGDVRAQNPLVGEVPQVYVPLAQSPITDLLLMLQTDVPPLSVAGEATRLVHAVDPDQPVYDVTTLEQRLSDSLSAPRSNMILMGLLGSLALALAGIGVFGVLSYFVNQRAHEIAIRVALGAQQSDVMKIVLGSGLALIGAGVAIGLGGALVLTRALRTHLYGVDTSDPLTFAVVVVLFLAVGAAASYIPAHRAARADAVATLRRG